MSTWRIERTSRAYPTIAPPLASGGAARSDRTEERRDEISDVVEAIHRITGLEDGSAFVTYTPPRPRAADGTVRADLLEGLHHAAGC